MTDNLQMKSFNDLYKGIDQGTDGSSEPVCEKLEESEHNLVYKDSDKVKHHLIVNCSANEISKEENLSSDQLRFGGSKLSFSIQKSNQSSCQSQKPPNHDTSSRELESKPQIFVSFIDVSSKCGFKTLQWPVDMIKYTKTCPSLSYSCNPLMVNFAALLNVPEKHKNKVNNRQNCADGTKDNEGNPGIHGEISSTDRLILHGQKRKKTKKEKKNKKSKSSQSGEVSIAIHKSRKKKCAKKKRRKSYINAESAKKDNSTELRLENDRRSQSHSSMKDRKASDKELKRDLHDDNGGRRISSSKKCISGGHSSNAKWRNEGSGDRLRSRSRSQHSSKSNRETHSNIKSSHKINNFIDNSCSSSASKCKRVDKVSSRSSSIHLNSDDGKNKVTEYKRSCDQKPVFPDKQVADNLACDDEDLSEAATEYRLLEKVKRLKSSSSRSTEFKRSAVIQSVIDQGLQQRDVNKSANNSWSKMEDIFEDKQELSVKKSSWETSSESEDEDGRCKRATVEGRRRRRHSSHSRSHNESLRSYSRSHSASSYGSSYYSRSRSRTSNSSSRYSRYSYSRSRSHSGSRRSHYRSHSHSRHSRSLSHSISKSRSSRSRSHSRNTRSISSNSTRSSSSQRNCRSTSRLSKSEYSKSKISEPRVETSEIPLPLVSHDESTRDAKRLEKLKEKQLLIKSGKFSSEKSLSNIPLPPASNSVSTDLSLNMNELENLPVIDFTRPPLPVEGPLNKPSPVLNNNISVNDICTPDEQAKFIRCSPNAQDTGNMEPEAMQVDIDPQQAEQYRKLQKKAQQHARKQRKKNEKSDEKNSSSEEYDDEDDEEEEESEEDKPNEAQSTGPTVDGLADIADTTTLLHQNLDAQDSSSVLYPQAQFLASGLPLQAGAPLVYTLSSHGLMQNPYSSLPVILPSTVSHPHLNLMQPSALPMFLPSLNSGMLSMRPILTSHSQLLGSPGQQFIRILRPSL